MKRGSIPSTHRISRAAQVSVTPSGATSTPATTITGASPEAVTRAAPSGGGGGFNPGYNWTPGNPSHQHDHGPATHAVQSMAEHANKKKPAPNHRPPADHGPLSEHDQADIAADVEAIFPPPSPVRPAIGNNFARGAEWSQFCLDSVTAKLTGQPPMPAWASVGVDGTRTVALADVAQAPDVRR